MVERLVSSYPEVAASKRNVVLTDVTRYVTSQIRSMPGFLRLPYRLALAAFNLLPILRYARTFVGLDPATQDAYLALWSDGPLASMRDFVKLIRSCALLAYFDHPLVMKMLTTTSPGNVASEAVSLRQSSG